MAHNYLPQSGVPTVSVVGARGYSGLELVKLLLGHPSVRLTHCFATQDFSLTKDILDSRVAGVQCLADSQLMHNLTDIVFLATPAEVSHKLAPAIVAKGKKVIDVSGAFRLKKHDNVTWYGFANGEVDGVEYGLVPFCGPTAPATKMIANPGCYATAVSMALIPLLKHDLIEVDSIVVDAKSGTTGGGRKGAEHLLFSEVAGECLPYKVGKHQHLPEIVEAVEQFGGAKIAPFFVTNLLPVSRGIIASIFARAKTRDLAAFEKAYAAEYQGYPLVRFGTDVAKLARLGHVVGTPFTHLSFTLNGDKLYAFSAIDNLLKGAASQAVENLNRWLDLPVAFNLIEEE